MERITQKIGCYLLFAIMLSALVSIQSVDAHSRNNSYYPITNNRITFSSGYNLNVYGEGNSNHSMGLKVVKIKKELKRRGYLNGPSNSSPLIGKYSSTTKQAIKRFQKKHGLSQTGIVNKDTWIKLGFSKSSWTDIYTPNLLTNKNSTKSEHVNAMIKTAENHVGKTKYAWGCSGPPGTYTDCSGLALQCLYSAGINPKSVNVVSHTQSKNRYGSRILGKDNRLGKKVTSRKKGDLVFYVSNNHSRSLKNICHVAIYVGNGKIIDNWPNLGVKKRSIHIPGYKIAKYTRVFW